MKTRNGFVSNSSTTSFCVLGAYLTKEEIVTIFDKAIENNVSFYSEGKHSDNGVIEQHPHNVEQVNDIFGSFEDTALCGYGIENENIIEITEKAKKLIEVLNKKETDIRVNSWSYTDN